MSEEIFKEENIFTQHDVENKQLKEENEKLRKEENEKLRKENEQLRKNNVVKDATIKESIEKPIEIKSPEEDKNTTNWFDKNKFKKILAIIDSNKFSYKNKIGEFNYIDIKDLVNTIKNNSVSEIPAKKGLNTLNKIKNAEIIKKRRYTPKQKELLNLINDLLDTILTDKTLKSKSQKDKNENEIENKNENYKTLMSSKDDIEHENENDKTLMLSNEDDEDDDDDDETMDQNKKNKKIKDKKWYFRWNNLQIKIISRANKIVEKNKRSKRVSAFQRL